MKKILACYILCFLCGTLFAQKKMMPASQSVLTGLELPAGSKKDDRLLSVSTATMLLEMESNKVNTALSKTEVLVLPPANAGSISKDTLVEKLSALGWTYTAIKGDEKFAWLQKGTRYVIVYFSAGTKETSFYLAEARSVPDFNKPMGATAQSINNSQTVPNNTDNYGNNTTVTGMWGKSMSISQEYGDAVSYGNSGYSKSQYTFFDNLKYNFISKIFRYAHDKILLIREAGTYQLNGNNITITPQSSVIESWSKKDGSDNYGKLVSSEKRVLEKVSYRFTKHYFSGIQQWNLVLQASETTKRDGPYSNNTTFSQAWYYSPISPNNTAVALPENDITSVPQTLPGKSVLHSGFSFTTTNFDDGWKAMEQSDWVHVEKNGIVVLIHYIQPDIKGFNNLDEATAFAWNTIVASRYSNISNLWIRKSWYADGDFMNGKYFAEADLTDNTSSKRVHVVLFRNGNGGKWIEIITPDKVSFQNQFSVVYQQDGTNWDKLAVMNNYNKFEVSANDLPGNWYSSGGSNIQYFNVYTGNNAGMAFASSNTEFIFQQDGMYKSVYKGVDNTLNNSGNRYYGETFNGNYTVTKWEMKLTNRFKGFTETFAIYFEAVKGGRILHMYRGSVEELHLFKMK